MMKKILIFVMIVFTCANVKLFAQKTPSALMDNLYYAVKELSSPDGYSKIVKVINNDSQAERIYSELKYYSSRNVDWSNISYVDKIVKTYYKNGKNYATGALIIQLPHNDSGYNYVIFYVNSSENTQYRRQYKMDRCRVNWSRDEYIGPRAKAKIEDSLVDMMRD